jgi:hypothetical protein
MFAMAQIKANYITWQNDATRSADESLDERYKGNERRITAKGHQAAVLDEPGLLAET